MPRRAARRTDLKGLHATDRRYRRLQPSGHRRETLQDADGPRVPVFDHDTGQVYGTIPASRGREPRPPLDWDRIGAILQTLVEGFTLRSKVDPSAVPPSAGTELGPYATAIAAVLAVVTRPTGDDASLNEAIEALFNVPSPDTGSSRHILHLPLRGE